MIKEAQKFIIRPLRSEVEDLRNKAFSCAWRKPLLLTEFPAKNFVVHEVLQQLYLVSWEHIK